MLRQEGRACPSSAARSSHHIAALVDLCLMLSTVCFQTCHLLEEGALTDTENPATECNQKQQSSERLWYVTVILKFRCKKEISRGGFGFDLLRFSEQQSLSGPFEILKNAIAEMIEDRFTYGQHKRE
ncbi:hypothetical protein P5673_002813 [Acropora cervicornis]|uniref:Uncharacterized protein n=1 Tax=Acropora cervicornis TaxID=6130 RepID=A0AAD9VFZ6_ACRCE|nr:hypothetical protein P5673_002813 [Acropora cervicornis]